MIVNEIKITQSSLADGISMLKGLRTPSSYYSQDCDDVMMNTSISDTSDELREMFHTLQAAETAFIALLEKTIEALEAAGISFEEADNASSNDIESLPFTLIL